MTDILFNAGKSVEFGGKYNEHAGCEIVREK